MTADERLEKLLNRFGQTISDLPIQQTAGYAYKRSHIGKAYEAATEWHGRVNSRSLDTGDYICHLADVIDRMETALETAVLSIDCRKCGGWEGDCYCGRCEGTPMIGDFQLSGMDEREFFDFVEMEEAEKIIERKEHTDA